MHRRQFHRVAAALTASAMLPAARAANEDRRLRVAVIGHTGRGDFGHELDTMWQRLPATQVVAVADPHPDGLAQAAARLGNVARFANYHNMLGAVQPDIVAVAARFVDEHHAQCLAAIAAGARGLYVEKPFCNTPAQARELVEACAERGVKLAVAHRNRYHPALPMAKQLVDAGEIGALLEMRGRGKEDARGGAQDLWVLGSHLFNLATYFAGPAVACSALLYQDDRPCTPADFRAGDEGVGALAGNRCHARFELADGTPLFFDSRQHRGDRDAGFGLQLIGTQGVLDLRSDREPLVHLRRGNPHRPTSDAAGWLPVSSAGIDRPEPDPTAAEKVLRHQLAGEDLLDAIAHDRPPLCDAAAGFAVVAMIDAVFASQAQRGQRVAVQSL